MTFELSGQRAAPHGETDAVDSAVMEERQTMVDALIAKMTLEQKAAQMLMPAIRGIDWPQQSAEFREMRRFVEQLEVGGYCVLGKGDAEGVQHLLERMQALAKIPLLVTADLEGGAGYQFSGATRLPLAMAIAATGNDENAWMAGRITAMEARALGINVNFYPVVDVNSNPRNPIINVRSFGEDAELVSKMASAYIRGTQEHGQLATAKHFPGHGDVSIDSHLELPSMNADRERLDRIELVPFRAAIAAGAGAMMSAHIALPKLDPSGRPATLSRAILSVLRDELAFDGLIFTDAMNMLAIASHYSVKESTLLAVEAGVDVIIFPVDALAAHRAICTAVSRGTVPMERIDASVLRILDAKERLGLWDRIFGDSPVPLADGAEIAMRMMEEAVTLLRDEDGVLPLEPGVNAAVITLIDQREGWRGAPVGQVFPELMQGFAASENAEIDDLSTAADLGKARRIAESADVIVVNAFIRVGAYKGSIDLPRRQIDLLRALSSLGKPVVLTVFGSPYVVAAVPPVGCCVLAYDTHPAAEAAVFRAITGAIPFRGRSPVAV
jgi:beta-N-acetylhexosaminidase